MKKVVLKVELQNDRIKQKVMKRASGISGVKSVNVDTKDNKLIVRGNTDRVNIVGKLRKLYHTEIIFIGPAKEFEKKPEEKQEDIAKAIALALLSYGYIYHPPPYYFGTMEEYPSSGCVIC